VSVVLSAENLHFDYGKREILRGISLELQEGAILSLLGPNGTGKSTLIKLLLGLLPPKFGHVTLYNKALFNYGVKERAKVIAYVPQSSSVAFAFSALDVVLMGRVSRQSWFANPNQKDKDAAVWAMDRLGIGHLTSRPYPTMSGGEKQLTLIARALAQEAKILIMDEPVSGLDYGNQLRLLETIMSLSAEGYSFLKSTHFPEHAMIIGGDTVAIKNGVVIGEGKSREVVTDRLIDILYETKVEIKNTDCGYPVCVPNFYRSLNDR
jgi:iron complex transport system ATP-binding protein